VVQETVFEMPTLRLTDGSKVFAAGRGFGVQPGERLVFRFTADSPKQMESMNFTTTGPKSKILGLYDVSPFIRDIEVDTSFAEPYELFIERETDSPMPQTVFGPLRIVPRRLFIEVSAEGQMDPNACWAASIAWWSNAMRDRPTLNQQDLLMRSAGMWNSDGTINIDKFEKGVKESSDLSHDDQADQPVVLEELPGLLADCDRIPGAGRVWPYERPVRMGSWREGKGDGPLVSGPWPEQSRDRQRFHVSPQSELQVQRSIDDARGEVLGEGGARAVAAIDCVSTGIPG
jgi:hypothetical protein